MVKKLAQEIGSKGLSVEQFATEIGVDVDRLLAQFKDAGISVATAKTRVTEEQKQQLLRYLQQNHGVNNEAPGSEKIVMRRAKMSEIKLGGSHGAGKTVSVQVRKKRTYIKRPSADDAASTESQSTAENVAIEETPITTPELQISTTNEVVSPLVESPIEVIPVVPEISVVETIVAKEPVKETAEEIAKANLKRKEKPRAMGESEESESEKHKKKRRTRETGRDDNKGFESLLARGADLGRVLRTDEEAYSGTSNKRGSKFRNAAQPKVKVQAFTKPTAKMVHEVSIPSQIILADLAQKMSVKAAEIIKVMMKLGMMATINQSLDQVTATLVVEEMGHKVRHVSDDAVEEDLMKSLAVTGEAGHRPPVITIMGHVDHGKTTLLDYIRRTKVAASEAGGITQHIGAYHVETPKGTITFLDTPGHAAFTAMRARGAQLTDIVILVVAADDGVMPQTIEAIQHAKAAGVPIVVAVNKIDKPGVDPEKIKNEMTQHGLVPEAWGGDTMFVHISAKVGTGVDDLLDSVLVQSEVLELKAVVNAPARGVVIESRLDKGRGAVMSVLVQQGTLNKGDIILAGVEYGRIRALFDERGKSIPSAGPSIPVEVLGLSGVPRAGDDFVVVPDEKRAREVAMFRHEKMRTARLTREAPKLEDWLQRHEADKAQKTIHVLIKADVLGSSEALKQALQELSSSEVKVNIIGSGVGGINESDVNLSLASRAILFGFNVRANSEARKLIEANGLDVHYHNIIYDVINQVKKAINGVMAPEIHEKIVGLAQVREVFRSSKTGAVAGCMVLEGIVKRNFPIRVLRDNVVVFEGSLESLRRFKEDVAEVRHGMECGISVKHYNDIKAGDQIEVFERIEVKREI